MTFKVLHVIPSFYPATLYGGPVASTYALCNAIAIQPDVSLKVLTTDTAGPQRSQRVEVSAFPMVYPGGYEVYFTHRIGVDSISPGLIARLWPMVGWADAVMVTATYSFPTIPALAVAKMRRRPVLWSPRGALLASESWSGVPRQVFKLLWERTCRTVMPTRAMLQVTSKAEQVASQARMPGMDAVIIPNGIHIPALGSSGRWAHDGRLRVMFLGRIAPIKGIEHLIEATGRLPRDGIQLDLYGGGPAPYVEALKALAERCGVSAQVTFHGHADDAIKAVAFTRADVLVLPSFSENFGMVVAEALAHGVPVIVARGVPWEAVEKRGCGLWVDNDPPSLAAAIASLRDRDLEAMGRRGREWMIEEFDWNGRAALTVATLKRLTAAADAEL